MIAQLVMTSQRNDAKLVVIHHYLKITYNIIGSGNHMIHLYLWCSLVTVLWLTGTLLSLNYESVIFGAPFSLHHFTDVSNRVIGYYS